LFIASVDPPVLSNGKEMNRYVVRSLIDTNAWLATTFVGILILGYNDGEFGSNEDWICFWNDVIVCFHAMGSRGHQYSYVMLISTHECGWKSFSSSLSWLTFVYDRGKL
jgi:hypothetical protein